MRRLARLGFLCVVVAGGLLTAVVGIPTAAAGAALTASFVKTSSWDTGYQATYTISNGTASTVSGWRVEFDMPAGTTVGTYWDALVSRTGDHYVATHREYNGTVAAGGSVSFGFVASGTGSPTNCTVNGASCSGGTPPSPTPTASPSPTPTGNPPPPATALPVAPYLDMGAWPTPALPQVSADSGLKGFTLAFITGAACKASWFNAYDPRSGWQRDAIDALRAAGGDVKISFGGASGIELAQGCGDVTSLTAEYQAVIDAYDLRYIDLDIEGAAVADPASVQRRSQALARLQQANPGLKVSLTLPVLPEGLTADGVGVVRSARDAGVDLDVVNVMAMDYYRDGDYGDFAVQAAQSTAGQLRSLYPGKSDAEIWRMVGVTPMLGENDDHRIYDQADARQLVSFAQARHLGVLAFWEVTRDRNACTGALYRCTNIPQQPYEFSRIFGQYTG